MQVDSETLENNIDKYVIREAANRVKIRTGRLLRIEREEIA